jgi:hypothetical protein
MTANSAAFNVDLIKIQVGKQHRPRPNLFIKRAVHLNRNSRLVSVTLIGNARRNTFIIQWPRLENIGRVRWP